MASSGLYMCCSEMMLLVIPLECRFCKDRDFVLFVHLPFFTSPMSCYSPRWGTVARGAASRIFSLLFSCVSSLISGPLPRSLVFLTRSWGEPRLGAETVVHHPFSRIFQHFFLSCHKIVATAPFLYLIELWLPDFQAQS